MRPSGRDLDRGAVPGAVRHGCRQRHAGLVLGRRRPPRRRRCGGHGAPGWRPRERRSSTSAANRRGRGRRASPPARSCARVVPVLERLGGEVPVSIDTSKAAVARAALELGADARQRRHRPPRRPGARGRRRRRGRLPLPDAHARRAQDDAGRATLRRRRGRGGRASSRSAWRSRSPQGIPEERICLDPGIGFGKTVEHNFELVRRLDVLLALGRPVLVGFSRKSTLGRAARRPGTTDLLAASVAAAVAAYERGAAILRVHDVREHVEALAVSRARWGATA